MDEPSLVKLGMGLHGRNQSHRGMDIVGKEGALAVGIQWFLNSSSFGWLKALFYRWRLVGISVLCPHLCCVVLQ